MVRLYGLENNTTECGEEEMSEEIIDSLEVQFTNWCSLPCSDGYFSSSTSVFTILWIIIIHFDDLFGFICLESCLTSLSQLLRPAMPPSTLMETCKMWQIIVISMPTKASQRGKCKIVINFFLVFFARQRWFRLDEMRIICGIVVDNFRLLFSSSRLVNVEHNNGREPSTK